MNLEFMLYCELWQRIPHTEQSDKYKQVLLEGKLFGLSF